MFRTLSTLTLLGLAAALGVAIHADAPDENVSDWRDVAGTGTHFFSTAIVHAAEDMPDGKLQRSTDTVELTGDLVGRVLFQPVSRFDFARGTLVNTGHQVFSGSVLGSGPVLLYDDEFRFEVDLETGATTGEIFLLEQIAGPATQCRLSMEGVRNIDAVDSTFAYRGKCRTIVRTN